MATMTLGDVTKVYDDAQGTEVAVEELSLEIEDGEFVVFLGPSGCGKSTTLRMIAGLESITDGELILDGERINDLAPKERDIALVFQNYALYPHKTVRQNMAYPLKLRSDYTSEEIDQKVKQTAELMGIGDLLDKKPSALSGGQQQRVATGRAIVREPALFLFDEPLSNLDAKLRKHMRVELARLHGELGITTVHVTHNQEEAMTLADRIVVLDDGELQQIGDPKQIYHQPANRFVADFIGSPSMNFFEGTLETGRDGDGVFTNASFDYPLDRSVASAVADRLTGSEVTLGVRPENITVTDTPGEQSVAAEIDLIETVGSDDYYYLLIEGQECTARHRVTDDYGEGETVHVVFDETDIHLFDAATGEAVYNGSEVVNSAVKTPGTR
jgi:multiple sugar transport system ATP-binding protein